MGMNVHFKKSIFVIVVLVFVFSACTGVDSITKKRWRNDSNSIRIEDLTPQNENLLDASSTLRGVLEEIIQQNTSYVITRDTARYELKFRVLEYHEGSRLSRLVTLGMADFAHARLKLKVGLFDGKTMLGYWEVESWVNGGIIGGSHSQVFEDAANEIVTHLKGDL